MLGYTLRIYSTQNTNMPMCIFYTITQKQQIKQWNYLNHLYTTVHPRMHMASPLINDICAPTYLCTDMTSTTPDKLRALNIQHYTGWKHPIDFSAICRHPELMLGGETRGASVMKARTDRETAEVMGSKADNVSQLLFPWESGITFSNRRPSIQSA